MAEDQGRQRGEDDGREQLLGDPQVNPPPSATSSSPRTKTARTPAADKRSNYYSGRGYCDLKDLPRHERRREIRKRRKPGESWDCSHDKAMQSTCK